MDIDVEGFPEWEGASDAAQSDFGSETGREGVPVHQTPPQMSRHPTPRSTPVSPRPLSRFVSPLPPPPPPDVDQDDPEDVPEQPLPPGDEYPSATRPKLRSAIEFIKLLGTSTLATQFDPDGLAELLDPQEHESTPPDDPELKLSLLNYISLMGCSQHAYESTRQNLRQCYPEIKLLSHFQVERRAQNLSGLVAWEHHMCLNSCVAFTGPYAILESCPICGGSRYKETDLDESGDESDGPIKVPQQVFTTFPVGPQIQARWKNPMTAQDMSYRWDKTKELLRERASNGPCSIFDDILCGDAYLDLVDDGKIGQNDTVLMLSIDGAQLHENKKSSCWIYIWILLDLAPDKRYKIRNILPGGVIPGPGRPEDLDSFLFPGLAHVSALQREGLPIWDAYRQVRVMSILYVLLILADAVAMTQLSGSVGHHGRKGCRMLCGFVGRNKVGGSHYYPALLRPNGFEDHRTSAHPDVNVYSLPTPNAEGYKRDLFYVILSQSKREYETRRFETGIGKPSIFAGILRILPLPTCFAGDLMHQPLINLTALLLDLWCARPDARDYDRTTVWPWAVLTGDVWEEHGKAVAQASKHLPTSFGRVPRNPQEKISSGYKAWELLYYIYGEGPGLFFGVLPNEYFHHFCKLVRAIRIIYQRSISQEQLVTAEQLLLQWVHEFEVHYCNRDPNRLHFVRQCVHSLSHLARETRRLGPLWLSSQWTMERVIGYLGSLLRQPSNPFRNLAAQTRRVATSNALIAMWPDFEKPKEAPRGSKNLGDSYTLLGPKDKTAYKLSPSEQAALVDFFSGHTGGEHVDQQSIYRWGRLQIPSEQIARSRWKEVERCSGMARTDRNVKILHHDAIHFAEVLFFFTKTFGGETRAFALVSLYSPPNDYLLDSTYDTLVVCRYQDDTTLKVIDAKSVLSVVAMVPFRYTVDGLDNYYFMIEKIGLDVVEADVQDDEEA